MVGFGSSLRMARRSGWERAYLDYENLKMLLSQIEAVYEEEGHRQRSSSVDDTKKKEKSDYRDELFIESNSDLAFASSDYENELAELLSSDDERRPAKPTYPVTKPFSLTYSHEAESEDESVDLDSNCGSAHLANFRWKKSSANSYAIVPGEKKKKRRVSSTPVKQESSYFVGGTMTGFSGAPENFILQNQDDNLHGTPGTSSYLFQRNYSNETSAFTQPSAQISSNAGGLFFPSTPPRDIYETAWTPLIENMYSSHTSVIAIPPSTVGATTAATRRPSSKEELLQERLKEERRRQRRKRRRHLAREKRRRDSRVPPHLRLAHAKARAITERFLGLLRAEVEKVTLFTQARLGELADTAGSLRFPSYDDSEYGGSATSMHRRLPRTPTFENPLSDGGRHPSASSSDDEDTARRGRGTFPWSDSSGDDTDSYDGSRPGNKSPSFVSPMAKTSSGGTLSVAGTEQRSNVSLRKKSADRWLNGKPPRTSKSYDVAQRQISHFADIRLNRPLFQRIDHILGEDLLLLFAVDEADGYTAVGVELMHLLRFICVNVIAVRKICRKHDRLLMNRMLGGYYHRKRQDHQMQSERNGTEKNGETPNTFTLGGIVSRSLGDSNARQVFVTGINQNKLTGLYDTKIQQLANSGTVQVISSSIALALSECEVSHSRADALAKLNSASSVKKIPKRLSVTNDYSWSLGLSPSQWPGKTSFSDNVCGPSPIAESEERSDDSKGDDGPPSTASTVSLTRLRFTVVSIFALREVARRKQDNYRAFISRSSLVFCGSNVIGEGLDGCSRDILDFFVLYNPDAALLLDSSALYEGLQKGQWKESPIGAVMLSTLAMGVVPFKGLSDEVEMRHDVVAAVSVMPISGDLAYLDGKHKRKRRLFMSNIPDLLGQGINPATLRLNSMGMFLCSMNYYIAHSTATAFVQGIGAHPAHSASIIGAASVGALFAALVQLRGMSREVERSESGMLTTGFFRHRFLLYSVFPILGNILHAIAVSEGSIALAVFGRLLIGCGSAELLHRQLLSSYLPAPHVVFESANLVHSHVFGVFCGLVIGGFLALFDVKVDVATISSLHSGSYFMACCWLYHWLQLYRYFQESIATVNSQGDTKNIDFDDEYEVSLAESSDTGSPDNPLFGPGSLSTRCEAKSIQIGKLEAAYTSPRSAEKKDPFQKELCLETDTLLSKQEKKVVENVPKAKSSRSFKTITRLIKMLLHNVGIPVTLAVVVFVRISHEMLFTSCAIITNRYFQWNGSQACFMLGSLAAAILPVNYVVERISRSYDERTVIKRSVMITLIGLCLMVNYVSFVNLVIHLRGIFDRAADKGHYYPYDWIIGAAQYICGFTIAYTGITALEPTTLSLMSKLAPSRPKSISINCGTVVTILSLAARSMGDVQILAVGLSNRLINTDIVNSLIVPLIIACLAAAYIVRRHFFFLI